jgi:hypothetical protein
MVIPLPGTLFFLLVPVGVRMAGNQWFRWSVPVGSLEMIWSNRSNPWKKWAYDRWIWKRLEGNRDDIFACWR